MTITLWRPTLLNYDEGPALLVDCEANEELLTHRALLTLALPGRINWGGPRRSLGHRGSDRRSVFVGTFEASKMCELDLRLYVRWLGASGLTPPGWIQDDAQPTEDIAQIESMPDIADPRGFCEPECNDSPAGHHPNCSQALPQQ